MRKQKMFTGAHVGKEREQITDYGFGLLFEAIWKQAVIHDVKHENARLIKDIKQTFGIETLSEKMEALADAAMLRIDKAVRMKVYREALLRSDAPHPQRQDKEYEAAYTKVKNEVIAAIGELNND